MSQSSFNIFQACPLTPVTTTCKAVLLHLMVVMQWASAPPWTFSSESSRFGHYSLLPYESFMHFDEFLIVVTPEYKCTRCNSLVSYRSCVHFEHKAWHSLSLFIQPLVILLPKVVWAKHCVANYQKNHHQRNNCSNCFCEQPKSRLSVSDDLSAWKEIASQSLMSSQAYKRQDDWSKYYHEAILLGQAGATWLQTMDD